jgi:hypothetical protein
MSAMMNILRSMDGSIQEARRELECNGVVFDKLEWRGTLSY